jgi:uncharacterized protein (TIGR02246 family)
MLCRYGLNRRRVLRIVAPVSIAAALIASAVGGQEPRASALAEVSQNWSRDWEARDIDAVLALYTDDAVFMDATGSRVSGKAQLRTFFATVLKQYSAHPVLRSVRSSSSGALGYDWGDYREVVVPVTHPEKAIRTSGTYLVILRNVSGRWLIANQMWTGNEPVPVRK